MARYAKEKTVYKAPLYMCLMCLMRRRNKKRANNLRKEKKKLSNIWEEDTSENYFKITSM